MRLKHYIFALVAMFFGFSFSALAQVAKIGETSYATLADALVAAEDGSTVTLIWEEGNDPIAMNGAVYGKTVTITGTAQVDWSKGWFFVGRGGEGNGTVIFDGANLTSASGSSNSGLGMHVSGREKNTTNKYDGTVEIKNSKIELDYLISKFAVSLDNSTLTVANGFAVGGRPALETESGEDATATIDLKNNSKLVVVNHNGMGLGYEALGVMNIDATSHFEATYDFLVTAKGTMNINGGNVTVANAKLSNLGTINAESATITAAKLDNDYLLFINGDNNTIKVDDATGTSYAIRVKDGSVLNDSYVKSTDNATVRFLGSATLNGGFECAYLQGASVSQTGVGGTLTIEDGTTVKASYGVDFSNNYTVTGGTIELSGGNASGALWGMVFQSAEFTINSDLVVDGLINNSAVYAPIHFTKATATVNSSISHANSNGEPIYINAGSEVSFGNMANVTTDCSVLISGKLNSAGNINGTITKAADGVISITGGTYTSDPTEWCAEGYRAVKNGDKYCIVFSPSADENGYVETLEIVDGQIPAFYNENEVTVGSLTYKRTLASDKFNALYVPFAVPVTEELLQKYDFFSFETNQSEEDALVVTRVVDGSLAANTPYLVRPLTEEAKKMTIALQNVILPSTATEQSAKKLTSEDGTEFVITGTYTRISGADYKDFYGVSVNGRFAQIGETGSLGAFRFYMEIKNAESGTESSARSLSIRISGESDDATGIDQIEVAEPAVNIIIDLQGRRVLQPQRGGLYIMNGKKVVF